MNINNSGIPEVHIVNIVTKEEQKIVLNLYNIEWLLSDVLEVDFEKKRLIIKKTMGKNTIDIVNLEDMKVCYSQELQDSQFSNRHSLDMNFYVDYTKEYSCDDPIDQPSETIFKVNTLVGIKTSLLFLLD